MGSGVKEGVKLKSGVNEGVKLNQGGQLFVRSTHLHAISRNQSHSVVISGTHLRAWEGKRLIAMLLMKEAIRMQQEWYEHAS